MPPVGEAPVEYTRSGSAGRDARTPDGPLTREAPDLADHTAGTRPHPPHDGLPPVHSVPGAPQAFREGELPATIMLADFSTAPEVGTEFLGFRLMAELGRGAFGRVYLARQEALANRPVVLKVSADTAGEAYALAQLQHPNVVPVYSVHHTPALHAVCMPYLGRVTLADVLRVIAAGGRPPDSARVLVRTLAERRSAGERAVSPGSGTESAPAVFLDRLAGTTYVQAVLTLAARLADGLAHAHERGILHRDLKPANILLTDEGEPVLLDFNLAEDTKLRSCASAALQGGTLPYMSPEQLRAFQGDTRPLDARSDLYALGVILYELLTGRPAFPSHSGLAREVLERMVADRVGPLPALRPHNRAVTPAAEAIIRRCLEPDPQRRYQTARELQEDLERHLADRPLRYAGEPSLVERARKCRRRHPRLAALATGAALAATFVLAILGLSARNQRQARLEALHEFAAFREAALAFQFQAAEPQTSPASRDASLALGRQALARYRVLENPRWGEQPAVGELPRTESAALRQEVGVVLLLMARGHLRRRTGGIAPAEELRAALRLNELAEACYPNGQVPGAVWRQRAEVEEGLGRFGEAARLRALAAATPLRGSRDRRLEGWKRVARGDYRGGLTLLQEATRLDPQDAHAWFLLGRCREALGEDGEAAACYTACIALWPRSGEVYLRRALTRLRQGAVGEARADFREVLRLQPELASRAPNFPPETPAE